MEKRLLIIVEWEDPFSDNRWHREEDISNAKATICYTVGWEMPAPKGYLCLASSRDEQGKCADRMTIPKGNVKKVTELSNVELT